VSMSVRGAMQGAGGERATRSYPQHCLGATEKKDIVPKIIYCIK
jgi:hypothetical protein